HYFFRQDIHIQAVYIEGEAGGSRERWMFERGNGTPEHRQFEQEFALSLEGHDAKTFVLDTNVLLHNPGALTAFKDNRVVLALAVIEELDRFKRNNDELGRNARQCIREIDT